MNEQRKNFLLGEINKSLDKLKANSKVLADEKKMPDKQDEILRFKIKSNDGRSERQTKDMERQRRRDERELSLGLIRQRQHQRERTHS